MKKKRTPAPDLEELLPIIIKEWRTFREIPGPPDVLQTREFRSVVEAVKKIQNGLYVDHTFYGDDYFARKDILGAYLLYQWVIHYQEALALIGEIPGEIGRVLDVCSGPLPMSLAALKHGASEVIATDRNLDALRLGAQVCGRSGYPVTLRRWDCLHDRLPVQGEFDLIILGHCLEELFPPASKGWMEARQKFVADLLKRLTPGGYLLIVESSFDPFNKRMLEFRDLMVKSGVPVQAPCVRKGECCAIVKGHHPCYAQREMEKPYHIKEIQRSAGINLSSLKMSYTIYRNPQAGWPKLPNADYYRVISPALTNEGGKKYYLCGEKGKKTIESRQEEHPKESRAFDYLRRGELVSFENPVESGNKMMIGSLTKVVIEAALNKPLPLCEVDQIFTQN